MRTRYLQLTEERNELANQNQEHQNLTRSLKLEEVSEIFVDENKSDPAVFISDMLKDSGVERTIVHWYSGPPPHSGSPWSSECSSRSARRSSTRNTRA